jgi:hypothetical protein
MAVEQGAKGLEFFHHQSIEIASLKNLIRHADEIGIGQNHALGI